MVEKGLRILLVEDSDLIRERVNTILSELKCIDRVENSDNGVEALEIFRDKNPDLVLLDINLPGKSGLSVLKEIRSTSNTPVVMLTNYSDEYYRTLCETLGADHFLDKSTEFEKIPSLISSIYHKIA